MGVVCCILNMSALAQPGEPGVAIQPARGGGLDLLIPPEAELIPGESRVIRSGVLDRLIADSAGRMLVERWLVRGGAIVLNDDQPGLDLHYYAQGIEAMTPTDRLWERWPRRADTIQQLVDQAITQARTTRRPIARLTVTGHAGLPGCAAFGGTVDDCVFRGQPSAYIRSQLVRLRPYLADDAEIELRQCGTGAGIEGTRLLLAIHRLTAARTSSYLSDFHFGDSAAHPRIVADHAGIRFQPPRRSIDP